MNKLKFKISVFFLFTLTLFAQGQQVQPNTASDKIAYNILMSAIKTTRSTTFKAEKNDKVGSIARKRVLYHKSSNGFNLLRRETFFNGQLATIEISNTSGDYTTFVPANSFSIKKEMHKSIYNLELSEHFFTAINTLQNNKYGCKYHLTKDTFRDIPVYTIKVTSPEKMKDLAKMRGVTEQEAFKNHKRYWKYRIVRVGINNNFIYTINFYMPSGRESHSYNWGKLDFTSNIPLKLFASPPKVVVVKNKEDLKEKVEKKLKKLRKK
jgi:hypothetical protein